MLGSRLLAAAFLSAFGLAHAAPAASKDETLTIFAAASLKNALDQAATVCADISGTTTSISYAGSSALARQIEQGAPADIFISADLDWMNYLSQRDLTRKESEMRLLGNRIVLIAPTGSQASAEIAPGFDLAGLLGDGWLAMANVDAVPAGKYGKAALEALGVWNRVSERVAQSENVRAALALVATGEAALGIVYRTDAAAEPRVQFVGVFPEETHPPIVYPMAELASSTNRRAPAFSACLRSDAARAIFEKNGFAVLTDPASN